jgi:ribosomal protein S18 acetylase RimI-like enzyme
VNEASRGKGVAGRLLQGALHEATAAGCHGVMVVTQGDNTAACHAYEKAGYQRRGLAHTYHFWLKT